MPIDTAAAAELLDAERAELTALLATADENLMSLRASRSTREDRADAGSGSNDGDPTSVEIETQTKVRNALAARLEDIESAFGRLDTGTYGMCGTCGREIAEARLEAIPAARHCVNCAGRR